MVTEQQKSDLAKAVIVQKYVKDQIILNEGDRADFFCLIKEGNVAAYNNQNFRTMNPGECFGEAALLNNTNTRQLSVKALSDVLILALPNDKLKEILKDQVKILAYKNYQKWSFKKTKYLQNLSASLIERIISRMTVKKYENEKIIDTGQKIDRIMVILDGEIENQTSKTVFKPMTLLFEEFLFSKEIKKSTEVYMAGKEVTVSEISFSNFEKEFGCKLDDVLRHKELSHEVFRKLLIIFFIKSVDFYYMQTFLILFILKLNFFKFIFLFYLL